MARVLLVEDDRVLRRCLRTILEAGAFQVEEASDLREAVCEMSEKRFDLIVTDYVLSPRQSGLALMSVVKTLRPPPPVILISGASDTGIERIARDSGVHTFLAKPFDPDTFLATCCQALM